MLSRLLLFAFAIAFSFGGSSVAQPPAVPGASRPNPSETFLPNYLRERMARRISARRDSNSMIALLQPLAAPFGPSTVEVLAGGRRVSLGTVVDAEGYVLTKLSEIDEAKTLRIRTHEDRIMTAQLVDRRRSFDVALLKVNTSQMTGIRWSEIEPPVGSFLVSVGRVGLPVGIGVVSVASREVADKGLLGVQLKIGSTGGGRVILVVPGSGAAEAGMKAGDLIVKIDDQTMASQQEVTAKLRKLYPGDRVRIVIKRPNNEDEIEVVADIREYDSLAESQDDTRVNGPRSGRLAGFELALQHDTVLGPDQCGGPVVDTSGRVIGINIARAGRVCSYCIPAAAIKPVIDQMLQKAKTIDNQ